MAKEHFQARFTGANIANPIDRLTRIDVPFDGKIKYVSVRTGANLDLSPPETGSAFFDLTVDGVSAFSGSEIEISDTSNFGEKTGLDIAVSKDDIIYLDLINKTQDGNVAVPLVLQITFDDEVESGASLLDGDLNATTNVLEKVQTIPIIVPGSFTGKNGYVLKLNEFTSQLEFWAKDAVPTAPVAGLPSSLPYFAVFEAFRETDYADGDLVPQATDQSGNSRHAVQTFSSGFKPFYDDGTVGVLNGRPSYVFHNENDGTTFRHFNLPNMSALTEGEIFYIIKADGEGGGATFNGFENTGVANIGNGNSSNIYPFTDGNIYCGSGSDTRKTCGNPSQDLTQWHCVDIVSKTNDWSLTINATTLYSTSSNTVAFNSAGTLGASFKETATYGFNGKYAAAYYFAAKLSSGERTTFRTYLTEIFGITF